MADTFTALLRLVLQETGGNQNVWGDINNSSAIDLLEDAIAGREDVDVTLSDQTLVGANGADDPARAAILICSGNPGTDRNVIVPSTSKIYVVTNETSPAFNVTIKTALGSGTVITPGTRSVVIVDSTADDVFPISAPQATETTAGIAEIATQVEVDAGVDDTRMVTPAKLASAASLPQATETVRGAAELADQAETDLGTDDERIITPLKFESSSQLAQSTESDLGRARIATQVEVDAGVLDTVIVTPAKLAATPTGVFRGAKVFNTANHDPADVVGTNWDTGSGEGAVPFNSEVFDTDSIHDNSVNNSRLLTPVGISLVRLTAGYTESNMDTGVMHMRMRRNGAENSLDDAMANYSPMASLGSVGSTGGPIDDGNAGMTLDSGVIEVTTPGTDYYELMSASQANPALWRATKYWFQMEIIA